MTIFIDPPRTLARRSLGDCEVLVVVALRGGAQLDASEPVGSREQLCALRQRDGVRQLLAQLRRLDELLDPLVLVQRDHGVLGQLRELLGLVRRAGRQDLLDLRRDLGALLALVTLDGLRSEERRVGKEGRARMSTRLYTTRVRRDE